MHLTEQDILKRVRQIEIKTRGLSDDIFAGKYHSAFRGRGMSFAEVREYRVGDDVRDIDWNVTARSERTHVKVFEEERELTMMLIVDVSPSRMFGSKELTKKNVITEIAATLAFSAAKNNDKVGCILFSDRVEKFIPPKKGRAHVMMIIRELVGFEATGTATNISEALRYLVGGNKKRATCFLLSDLIDAVEGIDRCLLDAVGDPRHEDVIGFDVLHVLQVRLRFLIVLLYAVVQQFVQFCRLRCVHQITIHALYFTPEISQIPTVSTNPRPCRTCRRRFSHARMCCPSAYASLLPMLRS